MSGSEPSSSEVETGQHEQAGGTGRRLAALTAGPLLGLATYACLRLVMPEAADASVAGEGALTEAGCRAGALLVWMAAWWLTEALPLGVTSLLPIALVPVLGISNARDAAAPYADRIVFLFLGGFVLALAMERWGLHKRIALTIVLVVGTRADRLVLGFMAATALLSMWMSNTATAMLMLPIAISTIQLVEGRVGAASREFSACLMLGIAYAASIGGIATPIGSPPNAILVALARRAHGIEITFGQWMLAAVPLSLAFLGVAWLLLTRVLHPLRIGEIPGESTLVREELARLGPVSRGEWVVMVVFGLTAASWMLRVPVADVLLPAAGAEEGGFWSVLGEILKHRVDDTTIAIVAALALFATPVDIRRGEFAIDWRAAKQIPWDVLLLFGGGLALASAVQASGLDTYAGGKLEGVRGLPTVIIVLIIAVACTFMSEVTSNTAQANVMLPVIGALAVSLGGAEGGNGSSFGPMLLLFPATMALSCAFMMPMGTPPNALVFSSGRVTIRQMATAGLWLNLIGAVLITLHARVVLPWIL